jgi:hypothetical protein
MCAQLAPGFKSEAHRAAFEEARSRVQFGGANQECCGARTRRGGLCRAVPIAGSKRCLLHCGPVAARAYRERQFEAMGRGEMPFEAWQRAERRRTANRIKDVWKRAPWAPGATIDLGQYEGRFQDDLAAVGVRATELAPSVLDAARWRWRRTRLDRDRPEVWHGWVTIQLRKRINDAGRPAGSDDGSPVASAAVQALFQVSRRPTGYSKRTRLDVPNVTAAPRRATPARPPDIDEAHAEARALILVEHAALIRTVLGPFATPTTRLEAAERLRRMQEAPDNAALLDEWHGFVQRLNGVG